MKNEIKPKCRYAKFGFTHNTSRRVDLNRAIEEIWGQENTRTGKIGRFLPPIMKWRLLDTPSCRILGIIDK